MGVSTRREIHRRLAHAVKMQDVDMLNECIAAGVDVDAIECWFEVGAFQFPMTALAVACGHGNRRLASVLIRAGASVDLRVHRIALRWTHTPLSIACCRAHLHIVRLLLRSKACANQSFGNATMDTILHVSARESTPACVQALLDAGANVNAMTTDLQTPLIDACRNDKQCVPVAKLLLRARAQVNPDVGTHRSPLVVATKYGRSDLIHLLLDAGANVEHVDRHGNTPIMLALDHSYCSPSLRRTHNCIEMLLDHGANVNHQNSFGDTALHWACEDGLLSICVMLAAHGGSRSALNHALATPLDNARENATTETHEIVQGFLEATRNWTSPLHYLTPFTKLRFVKNHVKSKADLHARADEHGMSPIEIARFIWRSIAPFSSSLRAAGYLLSYYESQKIAFVMASHPRLGMASPARFLNRDAFQLVFQAIER